jgi:hypothetical protein
LSVPKTPPPSGPAAAPLQPSCYPAPDRGTHFWDYWRVVMRHRWTVILVFVAT